MGGRVFLLWLDGFVVHDMTDWYDVKWKEKCEVRSERT